MITQTMQSFSDEFQKIAVSGEWGAKRIIGGMASRMKDVTPKNFDPTTMGPRIADAMGTASRFAAHQAKRGRQFGTEMLDAALEAKPGLSKKMEGIDKAMRQGGLKVKKERMKKMRMGLKGKKFSRKGFKVLDPKGATNVLRKIKAHGGIVA